MADTSSILRYYRPERLQILVISAVALASGLLEAAALVMVVPVASAVAAGDDRFAGELGPFSIDIPITTLIAAAFVLMLGAALFQVLNSYIRARIVTAVDVVRRKSLTEDFLAASWAAQSADRIGRLQEISQAATKASNGLGLIAECAKSGISFVVLVFTAVLIDWRGALAIAIAGVGLFFVLQPIVRKTKSYSVRLSRLSLEYAQDLGEQRALARDIHVFGVAGQVRASTDELVDAVGRLRVHASFLANATRPIYQYSGLLLVLVGLAVAASVGGDNLTALGAVVILLLRSLSYGQGFQGSYQSIAEAMPYIERFEESRAFFRDSVIVVGDAELPKVDSMRFDHVGYHYGEELALDDIDLELRSGEAVGLVGPSGSGKSTLAQLLLRLRVPTSGALLVDGRDATEWSQESWSRQVALVPQAPILLHGTVTENIAFFRDLSTEDVIAAAEAAHLHEAILALPSGYETVIGETTRNLSGGQVQRIGIARALAGKPSVLVLDEPTSALDGNSEALIQETLEGLRGDVLLVIIAHRLSTLNMCDRLLVLEAGRIVLDGDISTASQHSEYFRRALSVGNLDFDREAS